MDDAPKLEWRGKPVKIGGEWFRFYGGIESPTRADKVNFLLQTYKNAGECKLLAGSDTLKGVGFQAIVGASSKIIRVRASTSDGMRIVNAVHERDWDDICKLRHAVIAMLERLISRGRVIEPYSSPEFACKYMGVDNAFDLLPWSPFGMAKLILKLISDKTIITTSIVAQFFPPNSHRTYVDAQSADYKLCQYYDIQSAYGQIARRVGDCVIGYSTDMSVNPRAIAFDTPVRRLAITDGFSLRRRGNDSGDVWDELSRKDLKPLRMAVIGAAMSQIRSKSKFTAVSKRKRDGHIAAHNIPMSLPREGRYLDAAMLATEFIREAVMLEHELSDGMSVAALTDGLIIQGYDYPPVLWPILGLKFSLKENGATSIRASNCYMIGDKATLNYPLHRRVIAGED